MNEPSNRKPLTIALNRGARILDECLSMLAEAGVNPVETITGSRKLVFATRTGERLVVVRGDDVPTYVEYGAADIGITGKDTSARVRRVWILRTSGPEDRPVPHHDGSASRCVSGRRPASRRDEIRQHRQAVLRGTGPPGGDHPAVRVRWRSRR